MEPRAPLPARVHQTRNGYAFGEDAPKIVKAGTNEAALDVGRASAGWIGRRIQSGLHATRAAGDAAHDFYQLRGDQWKELKEPSPEDDARAVAEKAIAAQVRRGLPRKRTFG